MNTDELIRAMAADAKPSRSCAQMLPLALLACALVGATFFSATTGLRPDWAQAMTTPPALVKQLVPLVMAAAAFGALVRLTRPEAGPGGWAWALPAAAALVVAAFAIAAAGAPPPDWRAAVMGGTNWNCLLSIATVGLLMLAGAFAALRRGASAHPRLSGALAGLFAGSASAALFASFCAEDNPMFWSVWYGLAIAIVTAVGAWLGPRQLRW